jgi:hypothetical protein
VAQQQQRGYDGEMRADRNDPIKRAAVLPRGSVFQHGLGKHVLQWLFLWRRQHEVRSL